MSPAAPDRCRLSLFGVRACQRRVFSLLWQRNGKGVLLNHAVTNTTRLVLLVDENLPTPDACEPECEYNQRHLCRHRFGPDVRVIMWSEAGVRAGDPDLMVIQHFISTIRAGVPGTSLEGTQWVIVTKDDRFCKSARHEYRSRVGKDHDQLHFSVANHCVWTRIDDQVLHISVAPVFVTEPGRAAPLGKMIACAKGLLGDQ